MRTTLLVLLLCQQSFAQTIAPPIDAELRARFGFVGPAIHKMGWGIGLMQVARLDSREGPAVAVVNNGRRARLELLRCEGETISTDTESTDGEIQGLAVADVDGDGKRDFLMLTGRGRLVTRLRGKGAPEVAPIDVGAAAFHGALRAGDLNGDGKADALVMTREGLRRVMDIAGSPTVSPADPVLAQKVRSFALFDADGDGALDVMLGTADSTMGLWLQRGRGDGSFSPWLLLDVHELEAVFPGTGVGGQPTIATVEGSHGRVVEYALRRSDRQSFTSVELTTLPEIKGRSTRPFAHGDVDGDGDADLTIADPERAKLTFLLEDDGVFTVRTAPGLSGVDSVSLADLDGDGTLDLLLTSSEERALAWKNGKQPLDAFPTRLPCQDQPLVATWHAGSILFIARDDKRRGALWRITRSDDGTWNAPAKVRDIGRLSESPPRLLIADLDGQHGPEVCYVRPGKGLHVLFATESGGAEPASGKDDGPALMKVDDGAVSVVQHDGRPALLVVGGRFARVLRFSGDRKPIVLAQDNGPEGIEQLSRGIELDGGVRAYLDHQTSKAWLAIPGRAAVSVDVPKFGATHMIAHQDSVLLLAKAGVVRVPFGAGAWELDQLRVHEPPTDKTSYYRGVAADLDGDGHKELALADSEIHGFHVLVADGDKLERGLSFRVFEASASQRGGEPRDFVPGDLNGDGLTDLVVLCHDRVLVYLQEK